MTPPAGFPPPVPPPSVAVVRAFFVAVGHRDGGAVGDLFADRAELDVPGAHLCGAVEIRDLFDDLLRCRLPGLGVGPPSLRPSGRVDVPLMLSGARRALPLAASFWIDDGRIHRLVGRERPAVPIDRTAAPRSTQHTRHLVK